MAVNPADVSGVGDIGGLGVGVFVGVFVSVGVIVGVLVDVCVGVGFGVLLGVAVLVGVVVCVGVSVYLGSVFGIVVSTPSILHLLQRVKNMFLSTKIAEYSKRSSVPQCLDLLRYLQFA